MDSGCCVLQLSKVETGETENENQMKELLYRQKYRVTSMKVIMLNKGTYVQSKFS